MSKFTIYQIDARKHPELARDAMFYREEGKIFSQQRARDLIASGFGYVKVATVEAINLDHVYELTNLWEDPGSVERHAPMHSLSIGDIVVNDAGVVWIVAQFGFDCLGKREMV